MAIVSKNNVPRGRPRTRNLAPKTTQERIGAKVAARREQLGLTVEQACEASGISRSAWYRLEGGLNKRIDQVMLHLVAAFLKVKPGDLN